ncbi:hypothetical protein [Mesorhizobium wenxiniae]|uniref:Transglycosylase SLT domain-containing protein n=1 Tax=Mesorhizobium wenxiniae TaxID=2014805 RepID=A0A271KE71_9HYPH|nr:hypothetical protein [Mesorhizobium wenxiniae]PAP93986.1 hypothetical protein CIT31_16600 [Mesorhizobium wenxiniae]
MREDIKKAILDAAAQLGVSPLDLGTAVSYETAGTFDPLKKGPTTQWGQHQGLIQWGQPQAQKYLGGDFSPESQAKGMVGYLRDTGVKPGMGLLDIYSAINAGGVGKYNASDANNGGAPGTVRDKVEQQMAGHRKNAMGLLGSDFVTDGPKGQESFGLAPATASQPQPGGMLSDPSIPMEVAEYAASPEPQSFGDRLQGAFKILAGTPNAPMPRMGPMGDARQTGDALLKQVNAPKFAQHLYQKRMG